MSFSHSCRVLTRLSVFFLFLLFLLMVPVAALADTITVTTTSDAGTGSLREAINTANGDADHDTIVFSIPITDAGYHDADGGACGPGDDCWWTITAASGLPAIRESVTISGTTQTSNRGDTNPGQVGTGGDGGRG